MRRALTLILGVALFGILAAVVVASQGADDPANTNTVTETVEHTTTVQDNPKRVRDDDNDAAEREDVRGPCDEAEHANDPRCTGAAVPAPQGDDDQGEDQARVDNSGPGSLNSGPGSVHSGRDDDRGEVEPGDDHGGHGEVEVGDDHGGGGNSGPGGGHDD